MRPDDDMYEDEEYDEDDDYDSAEDEADSPLGARRSPFYSSGSGNLPARDRASGSGSYGRSDDPLRSGARYGGGQPPSDRSRDFGVRKFGESGGSSASYGGGSGKSAFTEKPSGDRSSGYGGVRPGTAKPPADDKADDKKKDDKSGGGGFGAKMGGMFKRGGDDKKDAGKPPASKPPAGDKSGGGGFGTKVGGMFKRGDDKKDAGKPPASRPPAGDKSGGGLGAKVGGMFKRGGDKKDASKPPAAKQSQSQSSGGGFGRPFGGGGSGAKSAPSAAPPSAGKSDGKPKQEGGPGLFTRMRERLPFGHRAKAERKSKTAKARESKGVKVTSEGLSLDDKLDIAGVALMFASLVIFFSSLSSQQGAITGWINTQLSQTLGWGAIFVPFGLAAGGLWLIIRHFGEEAPELDTTRLAGLGMAYIGLLVVLMIAETFVNPRYAVADVSEPVLFQLVIDATVQAGDGGGRVGAWLYVILVRNVGEVGAIVAAIGWMMVSLMLMTRTSAAELAVVVISLWRSWRLNLQHRAQARRAERLRQLEARQDEERARDDELTISRPPPQALPEGRPAALPEGADSDIAQRDIAIRVGGQQLPQTTDHAAEAAAHSAEAHDAPPMPQPATDQDGGGLFGRMSRALPFNGDKKRDESIASPPQESRSSGLFGRMTRALPFGGDGDESPDDQRKGGGIGGTAAALTVGAAAAVGGALRSGDQSTPEDDGSPDQYDESRLQADMPRRSPFDDAPPDSMAQGYQPPDDSRFAPPHKRTSPTSEDAPFSKPDADQPAFKPRPFSEAGQPSEDSAPPAKPEAAEDIIDTTTRDINAQRMKNRAARLNDIRRFGTTARQSATPAKAEDQSTAAQKTSAPPQQQQQPAPQSAPQSAPPQAGRAFTMPGAESGKPAEPVKPAERAESSAPKSAEKPQSAQQRTSPPARPKQRKAWRLPDYRTLLASGSEGEFDRDVLVQRARTIEETLKSFGAPGHVVEINTGPVITQFGVEPQYLEARGGKKNRVKVSAIAQLDKDLQLALGAKSIRIEAPVPGKGFVGIEVPNEEASLVSLRDVMESRQFKKIADKSPLAIALGQSVDGAPVSANLASMPHLLIAGTTGSGKSVCVNAVIASLLIRNTPETLKFIMVDPKRVELTGYNGIPHLVAPVVVELERIVGVLKWVTREMDERYKKFSNVGARNIEDYNTHREQGTEQMPYIVVIIDELADLMMLAPDETERVITRIAALARATGIHLVIATQRPSVDVVTGLIKANFPARIAFAVAGGVDSRVILDQPGAERLLGKGDMLYMSGDSPAPLRLQGVYLSDMEIRNINNFWKSQGLDDVEQRPITALVRDDERAEQDERPAVRFTSPPATEQTTAPRTFWDEVAPSNPDNHSAGFGTTSADENAHEDELYEEAVELVRRLNKASVSLLQRRLRIGYTRAARLIDVMEAEGVVGPPTEGSKPREVLPHG